MLNALIHGTLILFFLLYRYMDELRIYSRAIEALEIEAEASSVMSQIEPAYVQLGCVDCTATTAKAYKYIYYF